MTSSKLPNTLLPNFGLWCIIMSWSIMQKYWRFIWSKFDSFYHIFWTADPLATKFGLTVHHHRQSVLWRNGIAVFKVKVTEKCQISVNVNCLSRWCLLNCWTVYCQTWYCDASSWARLSSKKIGLLFLRSRSQQGLIWSTLTVPSIYLLNCWSFFY